MNLSAGNARRKWPCGGPGRGPGAIVTVATVVAVLIGPAGPAAAARKPSWGGLEDLFGRSAPAPRSRSRSVSTPAPVPLPVPMPRPRPVEASGPKSDVPGERAEPKKDSKQDAKEDARQDAEEDAKEDAKEGAKDDTRQDKDAARPAGPATPAAPEPSACRRALTEEVAIAPSIPDIHGTGGCGGEDLVRLDAVVLPDKRRVALTPAATLRCTMALAIADWVRTDVAPLAAGLGSPLTALDNFDSYECRGRNRVVGAQLSEHGRANALDVRGFKLADGRSVGLTDRAVPHEVRETVLQSVCARFTTVLGPGSDWYHEDHIHLDLMQRRNSNYRICQWNVWEPMPQIAPLLPAERPEEAPPREVASAPGDAKSETKPEIKSETKPEVEPESKSKAAPGAKAKDAAEPDDRANQPAAKPATTKPKAGQPTTVQPARKKRR